MKLLPYELISYYLHTCLINYFPKLMVIVTNLVRDKINFTVWIFGEPVFSSSKNSPTHLSYGEKFPP